MATTVRSWHGEVQPVRIMTETRNSKPCASDERKKPFQRGTVSVGPGKISDGAAESLT